MKIMKFARFKGRLSKTKQKDQTIETNKKYLITRPSSRADEIAATCGPSNVVVDVDVDVVVVDVEVVDRIETSNVHFDAA